MKLETLRKLYVTQLEDIYSTETALLEALPQMANATSHPLLKKAFQNHLAETKKQVKRLDEIFKFQGSTIDQTKTNKTILGLVADAQEVINAQGDDGVVDAGLIGAAQKVEHYEIATYGTLLAYAKLLGENRAVKLLKASLNEEKSADKKLSGIAESMVNKNAVYANDYDAQYENNGAAISLSGLLLGALAGVAAGLLLAPSSGVDTRKKIVDTAGSLKDQVGSTITDLTNTAKSTVGQLTGNTNVASKNDTNGGFRGIE